MNVLLARCGGSEFAAFYDGRTGCTREQAAAAVLRWAAVHAAGRPLVAVTDWELP